MERKEAKRELILNAAAELFASKGFEGTSIDEIGAAANLKGPALYYYFKGKDAIIEAMIEHMEAYYEAQFGSAQNVHSYPETYEEFAQMTLARTEATIRNPKLIEGRKVMTLGQFKDERLAKLATQHNVTGIAKLNELLISNLIDNGVLTDEYDPEVLAYEFVTPISSLILVADRDPQNVDDVLALIKRHVDHFGKVYRKK